MGSLMIWIWGALAVLFIIIEVALTGILQIWFAIGSFCAAIVAWIAPDNYVAQILTFLVVSTVLTFIGTCIFDRQNDGKSDHNRVYSILDKEAIVTKQIDNTNSSGQISINGDVWSARSKDNSIIEENAKVKIVDIDGVKAVVESIKN